MYTCILNKALAPEWTGYLCDFMKVLRYSLVNYGSNDKKMNTTWALIFMPIVVKPSIFVFSTCAQ